MNWVQGFGRVRMQGAKGSGGRGFMGISGRINIKQAVRFDMFLPWNLDAIDSLILFLIPGPTDPLTLGPFLL